MAIPLQREPEIEYPDSDGKPMAESSDHARVMRYLIQALHDHLVEEQDVFAWGNMLLYYEEGKLSRVAPDLFVVRGVPNKVEDRDVYLLWREGKAPCFVLEVTSAETREEDEWKKLFMRSSASKSSSCSTRRAAEERAAQAEERAASEAQAAARPRRS
jgi:Uma2 family endonuclease